MHASQYRLRNLVETFAIDNYFILLLYLWLLNTAACL